MVQVNFSKQAANSASDGFLPPEGKYNVKVLSSKAVDRKGVLSLELQFGLNGTVYSTLFWGLIMPLSTEDDIKKYSLPHKLYQQLCVACGFNDAVLESDMLNQKDVCVAIKHKLVNGNMTANCTWSAYDPQLSNMPPAHTVSPPQQYSAPPQQYQAPQQQYSAPPQQYHAPQQQHVQQQYTPPNTGAPLDDEIPF